MQGLVKRDEDAKPTKKSGNIDKKIVFLDGENNEPGGEPNDPLRMEMGKGETRKKRSTKCDVEGNLFTPEEKENKNINDKEYWNIGTGGDRNTGISTLVNLFGE